jgi:hypothetical protein
MNPSRMTKAQIFKFLEQFGFDERSLEMARREGLMGNYHHRTKAQLAYLVRHGHRLLQAGRKEDLMVQRYLRFIPLAVATLRTQGEWEANAPLVDLFVDTEHGVGLHGETLEPTSSIFATFRDEEGYSHIQLPPLPASIRDLQNVSIEAYDDYVPEYGNIEETNLAGRIFVHDVAMALHDQSEWLDARLFSMALRFPNNPHHTVIREDRS